MRYYSVSSIQIVNWYPRLQHAKSLTPAQPSHVSPVPPCTEFKINRRHSVLSRRTSLKDNFQKMKRRKEAKGKRHAEVGFVSRIFNSLNYFSIGLPFFCRTRKFIEQTGNHSIHIASLPFWNAASSRLQFLSANIICDVHENL